MPMRHETVGRKKSLEKVHHEISLLYEWWMEFSSRLGRACRQSDRECVGSSSTAVFRAGYPGARPSGTINHARIVGICHTIVNLKLTPARSAAFMPLQRTTTDRCPIRSNSGNAPGRSATFMSLQRRITRTLRTSLELTNAHEEALSPTNSGVEVIPPLRALAGSRSG